MKYLLDLSKASPISIITENKKVESDTTNRDTDHE